MYRPALLTALLGALVSGCAIGPVPSTYPPAQGPAGAQLRLHLERITLIGELLAVGDSTLLFAVASTVDSRGGVATPLVRVPLQAIKRTEGPHPIVGAWRVNDRDGYRLLSRYPTGVSPTLERRLVAAFQTDSVHWVRP